MSVKFEIDQPSIADAEQRINKLLELTDKAYENISKLKNTAEFFTINDIMRLTGYSKPTVARIFNDKELAVWEFGKEKIVFSQAFYEYAMKPHRRSDMR